MRDCGPMQALWSEAEKESAGGSLSLHACRISLEGQAGIRQIDSFNSFEARKATFLLALI